MKLMSLLRVALSMVVLAFSVTAAKATPAYGYVNLTIYGWLTTPSPTPTTAFCNGSLSMIPSFSTPGIIISQATATKSTTVVVPANTQSFTCQITIPYYFNNAPTGASLAVGFQVSSGATNTASVSEVVQAISPIPTNWTTTPVTAVALL